MPASATSARERAAAYIAAMGPAIQGQHGDDHTYRVACVLVIGFALPGDVALDLFRAWNTACQPPWSDRDLIKKLHNAQSYGRRPVGALADAQGPRFVADADHTIDVLLSIVREPLDPERTVRELEHLGVFAEPDPAGDLRERQRFIAWLLEEADAALPWKQKPRKGVPKYGKVPREHRQAALLAAIGAYLDLKEPPSPADRLTWIMEQTAREHFDCTVPTGLDRAEMPFTHSAMEKMQEPGTTKAGVHVGPRVLPNAPQRPEDPETLVARAEAVGQFAGTLRGNERAVFDLPFSESPALVAQRVGTDANTVKTTRYRVRKKAKAWGADEQDAGRAA